jgi:hypothetical protein
VTVTADSSPASCFLLALANPVNGKNNEPHSLHPATLPSLTPVTSVITMIARKQEVCRQMRYDTLVLSFIYLSTLLFSLRAGVNALAPTPLDSARRSTLAFGIATLIGATTSPPDAVAVDDTILLRGTVSLRSDAILPVDMGSAALYITARPDRSDNVPKGILDGTRGKVPPVLIARLPNVTKFPLEFVLTTADAAVEGDWWFQDDLIVSARLDSDGLAATRDPNDLVGRGFLRRKADDQVLVELQGRGVGGKLIRGKKK